MIERVADEPVTGRTLFLAAVARLDDWPGEIPDPQPHFVAFLAVDASGVADASLVAFADNLLDQGAAYVCAWGPDCERVHDKVDEARDAGIAEDEEEVLMTTWHAHETLDEALWFALFAACPTDRYIETCASVLAIVAGPSAWADQIRQRFEDPRGLTADVAR